MGVFAWMGKKGMGGGRTSKLTSIQEARGEGGHCAQPSHIAKGGEGGGLPLRTAKSHRGGGGRATNVWKERVTQEGRTPSMGTECPAHGT